MTAHQTTIEQIVPLYEKWGGHATIQPMEYCAASECMVVSHRHCMNADAWRLSVWTNRTDTIHLSSADDPIDGALEALMMAIPDLQIKYHELIDHSGDKPAPCALEDFPEMIDAIIREDQDHLANEQEAVAEDADRDREDLDALSQAVTGLQKLKTGIEQAIERRAAAEPPKP